eukprot:7136039-Pyramimonas_sp.AAC.1
MSEPTMPPAVGSASPKATQPSVFACMPMCRLYPGRIAFMERCCEVYWCHLLGVLGLGMKLAPLLGPLSGVIRADTSPSGRRPAWSVGTPSVECPLISGTPIRQSNSKRPHRLQ